MCKLDLRLLLMVRNILSMMRLLLRYSLSYLLVRVGRLHPHLYFFFLYCYAYVILREFFFNDAHDHVYPHPCARVSHDFHRYVYDRVCVHSHPFFHDYVNDYAFFISDLTNVLSLCDHGDHFKFLQNDHFLSKNYHFYLHEYDREDDLFYL